MNDKKLWTIFSQFIRLRDSNENGYCQCITCGCFRYWKQMDCGHGIGRQHQATKFDEKNNHAQCKKCNGFEEGKKVEYKKAIDKKYGPGTWDLLELKSRMRHSRGNLEIAMMIVHYTKEVATLRGSKDLRE